MRLNLSCKLRNLFTLFILIYVLSLTSCLSLGDGSDKIIKVASNNAHSRKAILFARESGTTVADSYQISILNYKAEFDTTEVGNCLTVDDDRGKARLIPASIDFNWLSDSLLEIRYDKNLRAFIMESTVKGVSIIYKTK